MLSAKKCEDSYAGTLLTSGCISAVGTGAHPHPASSIHQSQRCDTFALDNVILYCLIISNNLPSVYSVLSDITK